MALLVSLSTKQMNNISQPQPGTHLATFPDSVWKVIFTNLDRDSMISIRKVTSGLDCCIPAIYNPTLQLDEAMPLFSRYLKPKEVLSLRQVNSIWRQCTDNLLNSWYSDVRGEIVKGTPTSHLKFSRCVDFQKFDDHFGLLNLQPVVHRRVVLKIPRSPTDIPLFMAAARKHLERYGELIWHLRIETDVLVERQLNKANGIISFTIRCLAYVVNLKTFYWSTKCMKGLKEDQLHRIFEIVTVPQMEHLLKFDLDPFRPLVWSNLANGFFPQIKKFEINCHPNWLVASNMRFPEENYLKINITPKDYPKMGPYARLSNWRLSTYHLTFHGGSMEFVTSLKCAMRQSQNSLEELFIALPTNKKGASRKNALNLLQHGLKLPNLKLLRLTNFTEQSLDCLHTFVPKVESLTLVNCLVLDKSTKIFNGDWKTECWNNVKINPKGWDSLQSLKTVTITADLFNASKKHKGNWKFSKIIERQ